MNRDPVIDRLLEKSFLQFRVYLLDQEIIQGNKLFIDGTKIEDDTSKFTFY